MKSILLALIAFTTPASSSELPAPSLRRTMIETAAAELTRLDGEGLRVREGRRDFAVIAQELARDAEQAQDVHEFMRAAARLDLAYPNLHANFEPGEWYTPPEAVMPKVGFSAEWLAPGQVRQRITRVDPDLRWEGDTAPKPGDYLVAINGRAISEWEREHFDFCKWPLKDQCDAMLSSEFYREMLSWTRKDPLQYTVQRGGKTWNIKIPLKARPPRSSDPKWRLCGNFPDRYPGFRLAYAGRYACFYENTNDPSTVALRILSFQYTRADGNHPIRSLEHEVKLLWDWWKKHASATKHLVIDLSDNGGGNAPIPYYEIFFPGEFQEQWVRFKKIPELDDANLRDSLVWGTEAQQITLRNFRKEGSWDKTAWGDFLPAMPMFCAYPDRDCREGRFSVRDHGFTGRVSLITNPYCVSSCDGFVYAFKEQLKDRVTIVGQPQAADSAYSRLTVNLSIANGRVESKVVPIRHSSIRQSYFAVTAAATLAVREDGTVTSGKPLEVDRFVPYVFGEEDQWIQNAMARALE